MPSLRVPYLRTALQPWARVLPRAQPITNQIRQQSQKPADKGTTGGYKLDGTNAATSNRNLMYVYASIRPVGVYTKVRWTPDADYLLQVHRRRHGRDRRHLLFRSFQAGQGCRKQYQERPGRR